jgi:cytochrome c-type biogenesis protein CcmH
MNRYSRIVGLVVLALGLALGVAAQETTPAPNTAPQVTQDQVNAVARRMFCPICENEPLDVCQTETCQQWRNEIAQQLAAGRTPDQIIDDFVARFGERVSATPRDPFLRAFSLYTPFVFGAIILLVGIWTFWRWSKRATVTTAPTPTPSANASITEGDEYRARLERDL